MRERASAVATSRRVLREARDGIRSPRSHPWKFVARAPNSPARAVHTGVERERGLRVTSYFMGSTARRVLTTLGLVLAIPAACLGGLLAYGRALSEAQVAEGTLLSPEESRARSEAFARRFAAMSPAEHLEAARHDLDCGYDRELDLGGNVEGARRHLDAIPATAPERAGAQSLRAVIERRSANVFPAFHRRFDEVLRGAHDASEAEDWDQRAARIGLAHSLDRFSGHGLACVHTEASWARVLRFDHPACDRAWLDRMVGPARLAGLRSFGFTAVRCGNGSASIPLGAGR